MGAIAPIAFLTLFASCKETAPQEAQKEVEALPYYSDPSFTPQWGKEKIPANVHTVFPFTLTNQYGETVTDQTVKGKIRVVNFFFTSCGGICPGLTASMKTVQQAYKNEPDVVLLSHSVTPTKDSVEVLREYADGHGVQKGKWHLLTGDRDQIYELGRKSYFIEEDLGFNRSSDEFLHTENFVLIDQNGHIRGIYNGLNRQSVQQLIEDVKMLL